MGSLRCIGPDGTPNSDKENFIFMASLADPEVFRRLIDHGWDPKECTPKATYELVKRVFGGGSRDNATPDAVMGGVVTTPATSSTESSVVLPSSVTLNATTANTVLDHVQTYHNTRCLASPIYAFLLLCPNDRTTPLVRFTHASKGLFTARLTLGPQHLNSGGGIHGSVSATLVDWAGGLAVAAWDLRAATGVSVDINVSYMSSAKLGDEVEIQGKVDRVGSNMAFTDVKIWKVVGGLRGPIVISGRHTKFVKGTAPART
jgi:acyl-coenzyme A thioesterase 13